MTRETRNPPEQRNEGEKNLQELVTRRKEWARAAIGLACGVTASLVAIAYANQDWLAPGSSPKDAWTMPLSVMFFMEMAGLLAFCLQELKKISKQMKAGHQK